MLQRGQGSRNRRGDSYNKSLSTDRVRRAIAETSCGFTIYAVLFSIYHPVAVKLVLKSSDDRVLPYSLSRVSSFLRVRNESYFSTRLDISALQTLTQNLVPVELNEGDWKNEVLNTSVSLAGEDIEYRGNALRSKPGVGHSVDFEFSSSPFRPTAAYIPLLVSVDAKWELIVGEKTIATASISRNVNVIGVDLTKYAEAKEKTRFSLRFTYGKQTGRTTILMGNGLAAYTAVVNQPWLRSYALTALSFFALAWGCVISIAILVIVNINALGSTFRLYTLIGAVFAWVVSVSGLPDLAKIPLRPTLRRLYAKSYNRRRIVLLVLALAFLLASTLSSVAGYSLYARQRYSTLIQKSVPKLQTNDSSLLRQAFVLLPWRKDAQFLFEKQAFSLRGNRPKFRAFIRQFVVDDPGVTQTIEDLRQNRRAVPFYLTTDSGALNDPLVWFASVLPEGEDSGQSELKNRAIALLSSRTDPEAVLQRLTIQLELAQRDPEATKKIMQELTTILNKPDLKDVVLRYSYQVACDRVAQQTIIDCVDDNSARNAAKWFREELEVRRRRPTDGGTPLWERPPEKLMLYHMFRWQAGVHVGPEAEQANNFLNYCGFASEFEQNLKGSHPEFLRDEAWQKGTILDGALVAYITGTLTDLGWRY